MKHPEDYLFCSARNYAEIASQMLANISSEMSKNARYYSNWGILLMNHVIEPMELALAGENTEKLRIELEQQYLPELIHAGSNKESNLLLLQNRFNRDKTLIFVCKNYSCLLPVATVGEALELLVEKR